MGVVKLIILIQEFFLEPLLRCDHTKDDVFAIEFLSLFATVELYVSAVIVNLTSKIHVMNPIHNTHNKIFFPWMFAFGPGRND